MATLIKYDNSKGKIRNPIKSDIGPFDISVSDRKNTIEPAEVEKVDLNDVRVENVSESIIDHEGRVVVDGVPTETLITFESLNTDILTVNNRGGVTRVSDGTAGVLAKTKFLSRRANVTVLREENGATTDFLNWLSESLGKHVSNQIDNKIKNSSPNTAMPIWSTRNHDDSIYERNVDCWAADLFDDLTAVSTYNDYSTERRTVTAVTPRHCVGVPHFHYIPPPGTLIRFITSDDQIIERTVLKRVYPEGYEQNFSHPDVGICLLDEDLPASINHISVLPNDWNNKMVEVALGRPPVLSLNRIQDALVKEFDYFNLTVGMDTPLNKRPKRKEFSKDLVSGDSGNPSFFIINGELVLLSLWSTPWSGPHITNEKDMINGLIAEADSEAGINTGYTLTEVDLSGFSNYTT